MHATHGTAGAVRRSLPERLLETVGIALLLATLGATLMGILGRYLHLSGLEGSFEIAGLSFVWLTFIGTVMAEMKRENVRFDGVLMLLPPAGRYYLEWVSAVTLLVVSIWLAVSGWAVLQQSGSVPTPVLRWPTGTLSMALFSASLMLILVATWRLIRLLKMGQRITP